MSTSEKTTSVELAAVRKLEALAETTTNKQEKLAPVVEASVPAEQYANLMRSAGFPEDKITSRVAEYTQQPIPVWGDGDLAEAEAQIAAAPEQQVANTASTSPVEAPATNGSPVVDLTAEVAQKPVAAPREDSKPESFADYKMNAAIRRAQLKELYKLADENPLVKRSPAAIKRAQNAAINKATTDRRLKRESTALVSDAELESTSGAAKNQAITFYGDGVSRLVSEVGAALPTAAAAYVDMTMSDDVQAAYDKKLKIEEATTEYNNAANKIQIDFDAGKITEDEANGLLENVDDRRNAVGVLSKEQEDLLAQGGGKNENLFSQTNEEMLKFRDQSREGAKAIRGYVNRIYAPYVAMINPLTSERYTDQLIEAAEEATPHWEAAEERLLQEDPTGAVVEAAKALGTLAIGGVETSYNNPAAVGEFVAENIPQLIVGAISKTAMGVQSLGYGLNIYADSMEEYKRVNGGETPSRKDASIMLSASLAASALNQVSNLKMLDIMKYFPNSKGTAAVTESIRLFPLRYSILG